ncbi:UNVERIFIED_CONTAM: hypothetical protein Sangu_2740200 [Sesamum angustifolium]|uniref:Uncharacterized protein n=1 Tax=Sesamum angustifolium TaxID=2727405 RepID=A0AAW2IVP1_9LAMI
MVNSDNGGDNESYERNSSLSATIGPTVPLTDPTSGVANAITPNLTLGANAPATAPPLDSIIKPVAMNSLFYKQLH